MCNCVYSVRFNRVSENRYFKIKFLTVGLALKRLADFGTLRTRRTRNYVRLHCNLYRVPMTLSN